MRDEDLAGCQRHVFDARHARGGSAFSRLAASLRRRAPLSWRLPSLLVLSCLACQRTPITETHARPRGIVPFPQPARAETQPRAQSNVNIAPTGPVLPLDDDALQDNADEAEGLDKDEPARNLSTELAQAFGSPASCLQPRANASAPTSIDLALSTSIMPSGSVAQSEVQAAGLDSAETACLRARLEGLHFRTPIEDAPRRVSTTLHLTRAPSAPEPTPRNERTIEVDPEPSRAQALPTEAQPSPFELTTGNPEVGAPPLNAPNPP